jgi:hypothetical protein
MAKGKTEQGTLTLPYGSYVGEFKDGLPHGQGTETGGASLPGAKYVDADA